MVETERSRIWADGGVRAGLLIYIEGALAAAFIQLELDDATEDYLPGEWFLEAGFGALALKRRNNVESFASPDDAVRWVEAEMSRDV